MTEDFTRRKQASGGNTSATAFTPSRRSVLAGTAAVMLAPPARAGGLTEHYILDFLDKRRRQTVVLVNVNQPADPDPKAAPQFLLSWDRREFGPKAYFEIDRTSQAYTPPETAKPAKQPTPHPAVCCLPQVAAELAAQKDVSLPQWLPTQWKLKVHNASFPGNQQRKFDLTFVFERSDPTGSWKISASMTRWWTKGPDLPTTQLRLANFLNDDPISFSLKSGQNLFLKCLFGERIEAQSELLVNLDKKLGWSIDTPDRAARDKTPRLYVLDVPLEFGRLVLRRMRSDIVKDVPPPSREVAKTEAAGKPAPAFQQQPSQQQKTGTAAASPVPKDELLFEAESIFGRPSGVVSRPEDDDGLYGTFEKIRGFTHPNLKTEKVGDIEAVWKFDVASASFGASNAKVSLTLDQIAISFSGEAEKGKAMGRAAIRQWGYPDHTVAGCTVYPGEGLSGIGTLSVNHTTQASSIDEGPFDLAGIEIVRQLRPMKGVVTRLRGTPAHKEGVADLQLGKVVLSGLPAVSDRPGRPLRVPPITVEAVDANDAKRRILTAFGGRLAMASAAVSLPERVEIDAASGARSPIPGPHIARLEFREADALIYMPALDGPQPSSADAIIPIGPAPAAGKSTAPLAATFDLGRAVLTVLRPRDLLALKYRFVGLELTAPWPPSKEKTATLMPRGGRSAGRAFASGQNGAERMRDERPMLVVEFPPQHVVERAYFKRLRPQLELPTLTAPEVEADAKEFQEIWKALQAPKEWSSANGGGGGALGAKWRAMVKTLLEACNVPQEKTGSTACERVLLRKRLRGLTKWPVPGTLLFGRPNGKTHADFRTELESAFTVAADPARNPKLVLPEEQQIYVGPEFLDPDARRIALAVLHKLKEDEDAAAGGTGASRYPTALPLDPKEFKALYAPVAGKEPAQNDWPTGDVVKAALSDAKLRNVVEEIELARERYDRDYSMFRQNYRRIAAAVINKRSADQRPPELLQFSEYHGNKWFSELLKNPGPQKTALDEIQKALDAEIDADGQETFDVIAPSRLSGPSRVAFRLDTDDYEDDRAGGRLPFTLEGLTNWGGMDMAVVRRAERLMEPLQGTRLPPRWGRRALNDEAAILAYQGFTSSKRWTHQKESRKREPASVAVTPAQRLAEVYASSARAPDLFETAIELPFRLFLSPAQDATWITSSARLRREAFHGTAGLSDDIEGFRELWTARLSGRENAAGLRAIWSPDFRAEALLSTQAPGAPPRGDHAPWALPRSVGIRAIQSGNLEKFRTIMDAYDRHELVVLSSVHGLPVLGRRAPSGDLTDDADQIEPPEGYRLQGLKPETVEGLETDMTAIYRPKALSVSELSLSALGGNLDIDTGFQPPASARTSDDGNLFDAFSVERWRQRTVLGRDIVVEIVYKGFLFPLGHRASLVKLTERRFMTVPGRESPVAILVQRKFLRIGKPDKHYQAEGQPNRGSRWPCEKLTILTRQSPDLVDPDDVSGGRVKLVLPSGRIQFDDPNDPKKTTTGLCMWPRTARRRGAEVVFEMQIGDEAVPVRMPLIFVDNVAANDRATMEALVGYYNDEFMVPHDAQAMPTRRLLRNGQPVVMAPEFQQGDTTFETLWWRVAAEGRELNPPRTTNGVTKIDNAYYVRDSFMEGQDQPAFYPVVDVAYCRLKSVERFTGSGPLWAQVTFDGEYVANGFEDGHPNADGSPNDDRDKHPEIYMRIVKSAAGGNSLPLDFEERGDMGGGVARPTMDVVAISRRLGPINGTPAAEPVPSKPSELPVLKRATEDPKEVFPKAKFLGIMQLAELIAAVVGFDFHPKLKELIEYGSSSVAGAAAEIRSALTDALIKPAADGVAEVQKAWIELANKSLPGENIPSLKKIYPQVGADLDALKASLDRAQSKELSDTAFFDSLAGIHETARRLARTIDNIARDPLAAAASAQVQLFGQFAQNINLIKKAAETFKQLNNLPLKFQETVALALAQIVDKYGRAVTQSQPAIVATILAQSVQAVVPTDPRALDFDLIKELPGRLAVDIQARAPFDPERAALAPIVAALTEVDTRTKLVSNAFRTARDRLQTLPEATRKQLLAALPSQDDIASAAADRVAQALVPDFAVASFRAAAVVLKAAEPLPARPFDPENVERTLQTVRPVLEMLQLGGNVAKLGVLIEGVCDKVKQTLVAALATIDVPTPAATAISQKANDAIAKFKVLVDPFKPDAKLVTSLEEAAKDAVDAIDAFRAARIALRETITNVPPVCAPLPQLLPEQLRAVGERLRIMAGALDRLAQAVKSAINGPKLLDNLADADVREAAKQLMELLAVVLDQVKALTPYPKAVAAPGVKSAVDTYNEAVKSLADAIRPSDTEIAKTIDNLSITPAIQDGFEAQRTAVGALADLVRNRSNALAATVDAAAKDAIDKATLQLLETAEKIAQRAEEVLERGLRRITACAIEPAKAIYAQIIPLTSVADGPLQILQRIYADLIKVRDKLTELALNAPPAIRFILDKLANELQPGHDRKDLFKVYEGESEAKKGLEQLQHEKDIVDRALAAATPAARLAGLSELSQLWASPAIVTLFKRFGRIRSQSLRAIVVDALDLRELRNELDRIVRELVPSRATLSYDLSSEVKKFSIPSFGEIFIPVKGTRIDIKSRVVIDLLNPKSPDARIDGHMGPFGIKLLGNFDAVTLNFLGLDFRAGSGRKSGFDVRFGDFKIGEQAKFLKQLEPYVSPKGGLPPVRPMRDKPGIEASYGINLGSFGVGTLSFSNVTLNAGARLPFGSKDEAEFLVSIGRSDAPFLISSTIFGGGGYLALLANGTGFIGLETSFDYGGVFTFGFGPLTGTGQITLGVYFRSVRGESAKIGMNFMARGAANIACFGFSTSLFVRLTYQDGQMEGSATYTFSFSLGIYDVDFTFEVHVNQGGSAGKGATAALDLPGMPALTQFASLGAPSGNLLDAYAQAGALCCGAGPVLRVDAPSQKEKWLKYRDLFDSDSPLVNV